MFKVVDLETNANDKTGRDHDNVVQGSYTGYVIYKDDEFGN